nr:hypothetical protein [Tanacetum cinerariifolium]
THVNSSFVIVKSEVYDLVSCAMNGIVASRVSTIDEKRYKGTSELIWSTDSEEDEKVEESSDSDSKSKDVEDAEDEGPTVKDEDFMARDEGLAARVEGLDVDDEIYGLDDESYGLDDESHGEEEEVVPGSQQQAAPVIGTTMSAPLGLGYGVLRHQELALKEDHGSGSAPESERPERVSASSQPTLTTRTDPKDEYEQERTVMTFRALWRPVLALEAWAGHVDTQMTTMSWAWYDDHRLVHDMLLQQTACSESCSR